MNPKAITAYELYGTNFKASESFRLLFVSVRACVSLFLIEQTAMTSNLIVSVWVYPFFACRLGIGPCLSECPGRVEGWCDLGDHAEHEQGATLVDTHLFLVANIVTTSKEHFRVALRNPGNQWIQEHSFAQVGRSRRGH